MLYYVQFETQITVEANSFQEARDRAIQIWHGDIPLSELGPEEGRDTELAFTSRTRTERRRTVQTAATAAKPKSKRKTTTGDRLRRAGFDQSRFDRSTGYYTVRCSQCEALVISGVATHETGCPNGR